MPEEQSSHSGPESAPAQKRVQKFANQSALALELPFTLVGAVIFAGAIGFFLDKWLHTSPWFLMILGGLGFFAGVREVIRRLPGGNEKE
jgi:F0F1-type ATP synthase assembly protein I